MTARRDRLRWIVDGYEPYRWWTLVQRAIGRGLADEITRMADVGREAR